MRRFTVSLILSDYCWLYCGLRKTDSYYRRKKRAVLYYLLDFFRSTQESRGFIATAYLQIYEIIDIILKKQRYSEK